LPNPAGIKKSLPHESYESYNKNIYNTDGGDIKNKYQNSVSGFHMNFKTRTRRGR
jgi:hypothetical protein